MSIGGWGLANRGGCLGARRTHRALHMLRPRRTRPRVGAMYLWRRVERRCRPARPGSGCASGCCPPRWSPCSGVGLLRPVRSPGRQLLAEHTVFIIDAADRCSNDGAPDRVASARPGSRGCAASCPPGPGKRDRGRGRRPGAHGERRRQAFTMRWPRSAAEPGRLRRRVRPGAGLGHQSRPRPGCLLSDGGVTQEEQKPPTRRHPYRRWASRPPTAGSPVVGGASGGEADGGLPSAHVGGPRHGRSPGRRRWGHGGVQRGRPDPGGVANMSIPTSAPRAERWRRSSTAGPLPPTTRRSPPGRRPELEVLWAGRQPVPGRPGRRPRGSRSPGPRRYPTPPIPGHDLVVATTRWPCPTPRRAVLAIAPPGGAPAGTGRRHGGPPAVRCCGATSRWWRASTSATVIAAQAQQLTAPTGATGARAAAGARPPADGRSGPHVYLGFASTSRPPLQLAFPSSVDRSSPTSAERWRPGTGYGGCRPAPRRRAGGRVTAPDGSRTVDPGHARVPSGRPPGFWRSAPWRGRRARGGGRARGEGHARRPPTCR